MNIFKEQLKIFYGIIFVPQRTFEVISKLKRDSTLWVIPFVIFMLLSILSNICIKKSEINDQINSVTISQLEKQFDESIKWGKMTVEQKEEQLKEIKARFATEGTRGLFYQSIYIVVITSLSFLFVSFIIFGSIRKLIDKGFRLSSVLAVCGISYYLLSIKTIILLIFSIVTGSYIPSLSIAFFTKTQLITLSGFIESRLDIITIWYLMLIVIGLGNISEKKEVHKYIVLILSLWGVGNMLLFIASRYFETLRYFIFV
jgi:hypothetical protein